MREGARSLRQLEHELEQAQRQLVAMDGALCEAQPDVLKLRRYEAALARVGQLCIGHQTGGRDDGAAVRAINAEVSEALGPAFLATKTFPPGTERCSERYGRHLCMLLSGHVAAGVTQHTDGDRSWPGGGWAELRREAKRESRRTP